MSSNGIGFILATTLILVMALWTSPDDPLAFLDAHGAFVVIGGTMVIATICLPWKEVKGIWTCYKVVSRKAPDNRIKIIKGILDMARLRSSDDRYMKIAVNVGDPFLIDAVQMLQKGIGTGELSSILRRRLEVQKERENSQAQIFKTLGKYPPACGLVGTVMGMIALLGNLGEAGGADKIGPSMSIALAATLYGVILANFAILPVADHLLSRTQKTIATREMIVEGVILLSRKTSPILLQEILLSHIPPSMRDMVNSGSGEVDA